MSTFISHVQRVASRLVLAAGGAAITVCLGACATSRSSGASSAADLSADRAELVRLHELQRTAHLEKRADLLVSAQYDSLRSVSGGDVRIVDRERARRSFQSYFDQVAFDAWDDIVPPLIRISPDGRMAWVIVEKRVHLTAPDSAGVPRAERTRFAWLEVWEKREGRWEMMAIASTDRPDAP